MAAQSIDQGVCLVIVVGVVLLVLGWILPIPLLATLGEILVVIGVVLLLLGLVGTSVGGRRYWF
jgi:hypothetical protein